MRSTIICDNSIEYNLLKAEGYIWDLFVSLVANQDKNGRLWVWPTLNAVIQKTDAEQYFLKVLAIPNTNTSTCFNKFFTFIFAVLLPRVGE